LQSLYAMQMKKNILFLALGSLIGTSAYSQNFLPDTFALEQVIVEKYYVAGPADSQGGLLPEGATTYRVFLDLKPGYKAQIVFGAEINTGTPQHSLKIGFTDGAGMFYNNPFGGSFGTDLNGALVTFNTAILDSYLTLGAASSTHYGIPKNLDPDDASLVGNGSEGFLQNTDPVIGIPLAQADGMVAGAPLAIGNLGLTSEDLALFGSANAQGSLNPQDGQWFVLEGVTGPTEDNIVMVGQFTTIGSCLSFELNVQVLIPEELWCPTLQCRKEAIDFTAVYNPADTEFNAVSQAVSAVHNRVYYKGEGLKYEDPACLVGVKELNGSPKIFELVPNPTRDRFRLDFSADLDNAKVSIFDISGKLLKSESLGSIYAGQKQELDISEFIAGTYLVRVESGVHVATKRVVKY